MHTDYTLVGTDLIHFNLISLLFFNIKIGIVFTRLSKINGLRKHQRNQYSAKERIWFLRSHWLELLICKFRGGNSLGGVDSGLQPRLRHPARCPAASGWSSPYRGACAPRRCEACRSRRRLCSPGRPWSGAGLRESPTRPPSPRAALPGSTCRPRSGRPRRPACGGASPPPAWGARARSRSRGGRGPRAACRRRPRRAGGPAGPRGPGAAGRPRPSAGCRPTGFRDPTPIFPWGSRSTETERARTEH